MKNIFVKLLVAISLLLVLAACNTDDANNDKNTNTNTDDTISSISTDQSSGDYPHTQPIKTQDAKYKFKAVEKAPNQGQQNQGNFQIPLGDHTPNTNNTPNTQQGKGQQPQQGQQQPQQQGDYSLSEFENDVVTLTNQERQQAGLSILQVDNSLSGVAREKSNDMQQKGYFSHTSPTYGSPFDMMRDFGITYQSAGENIAQGQQSPEEVVQAWMNSEGHRANILNGDFTHIGVGYDPSGHYWTQMFIRK
ncbi:CAP domain-containing protein [Ornithinibacillus contaminans]|uniref:CAP domain-containing protein n=1 Tax=Ornithinibacillus contaminans TaxID=694055 RepID=UPI00064DBFBE|nr:CAP domain-containing protein [Ornithinibacillus contaminans]